MITRDEATPFEECWKTGDDPRWRGEPFASFFWPEEILVLVREAGVEILDGAGLAGLSSDDIEEVNRLACKQPER